MHKKMNHLLQKQNGSFKSSFFLWFTLSFFLICLIGYSALYTNGKTMLWTTDEATQSYPAFVYMGVWMRRVIKGFLHGNFHLPAFDFSVGIGSDALGSMNYAGFGEPIAAIFSLVPVSLAPLAYSVSVLLRMYLAGLAFGLYAFSIGMDRNRALLGSICYCFCGHVIVYASVFSPYLSPMIYLPLMLTGFEQVLNGRVDRKALWLTAGTAYGVCAGFYPLFQCSVFLAAYGIVRGTYLYGIKNPRKIFTACLWGMAFYILGLMVALPVLLQVVLAVFESARSSSIGLEIRDFLTFDVKGLMYILPDGIRTADDYSWSGLALPALLIPTAAVLCCSDKTKSRKYAFWVFLSMILLCSNLGVRRFLDGFGAKVTIPYRWNYLISFVCAVLLMWICPRLLALRQKEKTAVLAALTLYFGYVLLGKPQGVMETVFLATVMAGLTAAVLLAAQNVNMKTGTAIVCLLAFANAACNLNWFYSQSGFNMQQNCTNAQTLQNMLAVPANGFETLKNDTSLYRISDTYKGTETSAINFSATRNQNTLSAYWSVLNENAIADRPDTGKANGLTYDGRDGRTIDETLYGVKYQVTNDRQLKRIPYGYELVESISYDDTIWCLSENKNALGLGYVYPKSFCEEEYMALSPLEREQVRMQAVVLQNGDKFAPEFWMKKIPCKVLNANNMREGCWKNGAINLFWYKGSLELEFDAPANTEVYVRLVNFSSKFNSDVTVHPASDLEVIGSRNSVKENEVSDSWYCVGYTKDGEEGAVIDFSVKSEQEDFSGLEFALEDIEVYVLPMEPVQTYADELKQSNLKDVKFQNDVLSGTIDALQDGWLYIAVPYSRGWTASVDGYRVPVERANMMGMAIPISAGTHEVALQYHVPYSNIARVISLAGAAISIVLLVLFRKKSVTVKR